MSNISAINNNLNSFFASGKTKDINFRINQLKKLRRAIIQNEQQIYNALFLDLHKSPQEAYITEVSIVLNEINLHIKKLKQWAKPKRVASPLVIFPSRSYITYQPLGTALIIAPWNYPFHLLVNPLVGAISSGCCAMLKPSPAAPHTAQIVEYIIRSSFKSDYINIIQGDRHINTALLNEKWDKIFFTGSPSLGKIVYKAAAQNLTPVTLELGGKSPCIVDQDANIPLAAKRIAWGKFINAGQTCVAPDYVLAHDSIKNQLIEALKSEITNFYGSNIKASKFFPRIISDNAFLNLKSIIDNSQNIAFGGSYDSQQRFIHPTIIDNVKPDSPSMHDEIFGPILPIMSFSDIDNAISHINSNPKPLALYHFGNKNANLMLNNTSSGGACINDTLIHLSNHRLPFGGVGNSGMGSYHGHLSFLTFSHKRAVVKSTNIIDIPLKYIPFKFFNFTKRLI